MKRNVRLEDLVGRLERGREGVEVGVGTVARRVHVREVEHRADEVHLRGDLQHVVDRPEVADPSHHLHAERHEPVLGLQTGPQVAELVDDVGNRALAFALEQEAGMEDDHLRADRLGEAGGVVEHSERHLELLLPRHVAHERCQGGVDGDGDVLGAHGLAELGRRVVVQPEAGHEPDLDRAVAARGEPRRRSRERCGLLTAPS